MRDELSMVPQPEMAWGLNDVSELWWTPRESSCSWHRESSLCLGAQVGDLGQILLRNQHRMGSSGDPVLGREFTGKQKMKEKAGSSQPRASSSSSLQPRCFPHLTES